MAVAPFGYWRNALSVIIGRIGLLSIVGTGCLVFVFILAVMHGWLWLYYYAYKYKTKNKISGMANFMAARQLIDSSYYPDASMTKYAIATRRRLAIVGLIFVAHAACYLVMLCFQLLGMLPDTIT